jgi:hypothetical protein
MLSIFEFLRGNQKQIDDLSDIIKSVAIIEDIISSRNDASIREMSSIEKDLLVDVVEQVPEITLIGNSMPYTKEKSVVRKDKSRSLNEVEDFGEDLGGVCERKDEIEERCIKNWNEIKEDCNNREGITSTKLGMQSIHSVLLENLTS